MFSVEKSAQVPILARVPLSRFELSENAKPAPAEPWAGEAGAQSSSSQSLPRFFQAAPPPPRSPFLGSSVPPRAFFFFFLSSQSDPAPAPGAGRARRPSGGRPVVSMPGG